MFLDFDHIEFTLGDDPGLPLRVLVSMVKPQYDANITEEEAEGPGDVNYRNRFLECIFGPALLKLSSKSVSKMNGAGNPNCKKWHIYPNDWSRLA